MLLLIVLNFGIYIFAEIGQKLVSAQFSSSSFGIDQNIYCFVRIQNGNLNLIEGTNKPFANAVKITKEYWPLCPHLLRHIGLPFNHVPQY